MILQKIKSGLWKLGIVFGTYGRIPLLDIRAPNIVFMSQTPKSSTFLRFHNFIGFISWLLRNWGPVCKRVTLWFWSYGWIRLPGPSGSNVVSSPQNLISRNFVRFHNFIGFISWFLRKYDPAFEIEARLIA